MGEVTSEGNVEVTVTKHGPYTVRGPVSLVDQDGNAWLDLPEGKSVALCRCGRSGTKPFCDGTHKKGDDPFRSEPHPDTQPYPW